MVGDAIETGRERLTKKKVIMSVDCHFVPKLMEMKEGVGGSRVAIEGGHNEFPQKSERGDFFRQ